MKIYILQKNSLTDLKEPVKRQEYQTEAVTLGELIDEMVAKNAAKPHTAPDYIGIFDAVTESNGTRYAYEKRTAKFDLAEMRTFARQAFTDKIYLVKNVTKAIMYAALDAPLELSDGDELALIKLKYVRGVI